MCVLSLCGTVELYQAMSDIGGLFLRPSRFVRLLSLHNQLVLTAGKRKVNFFFFFSYVKGFTLSNFIIFLRRMFLSYSPDIWVLTCFLALHPHLLHLLSYHISSSTPAIFSSPVTHIILLSVSLYLASFQFLFCLPFNQPASIPCHEDQHHISGHVSR